MEKSEPSANELKAAPVATRWKRRWAIRALWAVVLWLVLAYIVLPAFWKHYEHQPNLEDAPKFTVTHNDIPGDPLNIGLVGTKDEVIKAMLAADWHPADSVTA